MAFKDTPDGQAHCDMEAELRARAPYHQTDHIHCWTQGGEPACGIPLEKHTMCCLCALPSKKRV